MVWFTPYCDLGEFDESFFSFFFSKVCFACCLDLIKRYLCECGPFNLISFIWHAMCAFQGKNFRFFSRVLKLTWWSSYIIWNRDILTTIGSPTSNCTISYHLINSLLMFKICFHILNKWTFDNLSLVFFFLTTIDSFTTVNVKVVGGAALLLKIY